MVYASYDIDLPHQPSDGEIKEVIKQFNLTPAQQEQVFIETKKNLDEMYKTEERLAKWIVSHKEPLALKPFIKKYKQDLRPYCPHCNKMIDLYKIKSWGNKKFMERFKEEVCEKKDN